MRGAFVASSIFLTALIACAAGAEVRTDDGALELLGRHYTKWLTSRRPPLYDALIRSDTAPQAQFNVSPSIRLVYIDTRGLPVFYRTCNLDAARTIRADCVWPGGGAGFALDGSSTAVGELGVWDFLGVYEFHAEFQGRVTLIDAPSYYYQHATLVAGTMVAAGIDPQAKGMSFAALLAAYEQENDLAEMAAAAATGMKVSNHSYGVDGGWDFISFDGAGYPVWFGDVSISATEDYRFGFYSELSSRWDELAYLAPYYAIVVAAGNDRDDVGPGPGEGHYVWDGSEWMWSTEQHDLDGGADGFDCITPPATAKNVITVGAVEDIPEAYGGPFDVVMSAFSSWGPADDGRIKPDIVANGVDVYSTSSFVSQPYARASGTSFAAPSVAGSLNLLVQHFEETHGGRTPRAAAMKAIMIQTADEAGPSPGPDWMFGWGLMNTLEAARLIETDSHSPGFVRESELPDGDVDDYYLYSDGTAPLRVTLAWTDPPGTPPEPSLNPRTPALVNDLDVRLEHLGDARIYMPYILDPDHPDYPAATGNNTVDNIEQIHVDQPPEGYFRLIVSHKGTLDGSPQPYSLAASVRMTWTPYTHGIFKLHRNYPNPAQPATLIGYEVPYTCFVKLQIYDVSGRLVRTLVSVENGQGSYAVPWDGTDARGAAVAPGIYFYRFEAGTFDTARKLILLR
jgi:hypothetical protein